MKKIRIIALAAAIVMLLVSLPLTALATTYARVVVSSNDVLHLRSTPNGLIIGKYRNGTKVTVLSTSNKRWTWVRTPDGKVGYMYRDYLSSFTTTSSGSSSSSSSSSSGSSSSSSSSGIGTGVRFVKSGIGPVNFRKNASVNSKLLDQLQGGTAVTVLTPGDTWCRVRYNGTLGWIKTRYLTKTRN